jgi:hypothetical protein
MEEKGYLNLCLCYVTTNRLEYEVLDKFSSIGELNNVTSQFADEHELKTSNKYADKIMRANSKMYYRIKDFPNYENHIYVVKGGKILGQPMYGNIDKIETLSDVNDSFSDITDEEKKIRR